MTGRRPSEAMGEDLRDNSRRVRNNNRWGGSRRRKGAGGFHVNLSINATTTASHRANKAVGGFRSKIPAALPPSGNSSAPATAGAALQHFTDHPFLNLAAKAVAATLQHGRDGTIRAIRHVREGWGFVGHHQLGWAAGHQISTERYRS